MGGDGTRFTGGSQGDAGTSRALAAALSSSLRDAVAGARWYQGKGSRLDSIELLDHVTVPESGGGVLAIVAARDATGASAEYVLAVRSNSAGTYREVSGDDAIWAALANIALSGASLAGEHGAVTGSTAAGEVGGTQTRVSRAGRPISTDQSNTSILFDDREVLKVYRRLRPGQHPERELLEGLTRVGSTRSPRLLGALSYARGDIETTVATAYAFVAGDPVGWEPMIVDLAAALDGSPGALDQVAEEARDFGRCAGELHRDLREAFGARPATREDVRLEHARVAAALSKATATVVPLAPELAGFEAPARRALTGLAELEGTSVQRIHGDLHVGQLVRGVGGTVVLDFEGDPTWSIEERLAYASPLRDLASLLLSLDHVGVAATRRVPGASREAEQWRGAARAAALAGYREVAPPEVLDRPKLLRAFEVEKEWREATYAAQVLPEWLYAPRAVLPKLLS